MNDGSSKCHPHCTFSRSFQQVFPRLCVVCRAPEGVAPENAQTPFQSAPTMFSRTPVTFWYVASPYTKYVGGIDLAFTMVCREMGLLVKAGVPCFSPIAHTHPIARYGKIDPLDCDTWLKFDRCMMEAASGIIVVKAAGWKTSHGVAHEIAYFERARKPVVMMVPGLVPSEVRPS